MPAFKTIMKNPRPHSQKFFCLKNKRIVAHLCFPAVLIHLIYIGSQIPITMWPNGQDDTEIMDIKVISIDKGVSESS